MPNKANQLFIYETIFPYITERKKLNLIKYNKGIQKTFNIDIINYKIMSRIYKIGGKNGKGKEYNFDGELIFEGEYFNGKRNGKGKQYKNNDELSFEGEYKNGKRNGKGKEYNDDGKLIFEGEYLNGERNGNGKLYNDDGKLIFEGEYKFEKNIKGKDTIIKVL